MMSGRDTFGQRKVYGVLLALCWITVLARMYVRIAIVRNLRKDDYLMMVSLCCYTTSIGLALRLAELGFGQHAENLPPENVKEVLRVCDPRFSYARSF